MFPVILFLSPCKQPLKAWCTLRNNLRQNILTRHWKIINYLSSLSFIQSKVRSDSTCLTQDMNIYIQALVSCVRLKMLDSCPLLLCVSIHACGSYRCCVWSIHVKNRAEMWKHLLWLAARSCVCCEMGHSSEGKAGCYSRASLERREGVWVSLRAELLLHCLYYCWWSEKEISLVWVWKIPFKKGYRRKKEIFFPNNHLL